MLMLMVVVEEIDMSRYKKCLTSSFLIQSFSTRFVSILDMVASY